MNSLLTPYPPVDSPQNTKLLDLQRPAPLEISVYAQVPDTILLRN
jgi:hypothetical protein